MFLTFKDYNKITITITVAIVISVLTECALLKTLFSLPQSPCKVTCIRLPVLCQQTDAMRKRITSFLQFNCQGHICLLFIIVYFLQKNSPQSNDRPNRKRKGKGVLTRVHLLNVWKTHLSTECTYLWLMCSRCYCHTPP
jgi:hypothetical protein